MFKLRINFRFAFVSATVCPPIESQYRNFKVLQHPSLQGFCDFKLLQRNNKYLFQHNKMASSSETSDYKSSNENEEENKPKFKNKLALERSPYLLQHATNPVDWYPWGAEAFKKAIEEDKMIFLSVGYSTCHWCHVMERESFENEEIAQVMNEHFVNIKVDREERPDVDKVYMTFVQSTTGGGGWPMSVWLTPELKPILGGTYFPPDDRYYGQPGFKTILQHISEQWQINRDKVLEQGSRILEIITQSMSLKAFSESGKMPPSIECIKSCYSELAQTYDKEFGGFGSPPKFPQPVIFNFLFRMYSTNPESKEGKKSLQMALHTLKMMARGGIHDHVGKGFHRYSTDQFWHVPHFEKMLYDQGQLAISYLDAYQITKDNFFADVARDILEYVSRDLRDVNGGFYSAEDADSLPHASAERKKEGAFYVWTEEEIRESLSEAVESTTYTLADVFCKYFNVEAEGNVDPYQDPHHELKDKNVLIAKTTEEECVKNLDIDMNIFKEAISKGKETLLEVRMKRPKPHMDDKFVTSWNGLMISGFARAAQVLQETKYAQYAMDAAQFLNKHLYNQETGCLLRSAYKGTNGTIAQILSPIPGVLEDYTFLVRGLLDLYEATYDPWCLEWASKLQTTQDCLFWDAADGGYYNSVSTDPSIVLRLKEDQDSAEPNPNSVAVCNLLRLSNILVDISLQDKAVKILSLYSHRMMMLPMALPEMLCGLMFYYSNYKQIIISGEKDSQSSQELLKQVHELYIPFKILLLANSDSEKFLSERLKALGWLNESAKDSDAYVCQKNACSLPVSSPTELKKLLLDSNQESTS
ncbi:spermatogenesis-associated protein 20 [Trichonephila inaurata madagascariensis]|uniref:Spermatogenesis-associated protein 20 n=1 Tax=Trichonephila inaurata madagascariensis TaxID=2747483 RepID=A0A8X6MD96_9ARAC|nr:spermatogenesis-associated protein 20 [Trichonephila inaurata madagascariensis]